MKRAGIKLIIFISFLLMMACEERFDVVIDRLEVENFVIQGYIHQSTNDPYVVTIERTQRSGQPVAVFGACVTLLDDHGNREEFDEKIIGRYTSTGLIRGQEGELYSLEVEMPTGELFRSTPDLMPSGQGVDQLSWNEFDKTFISELGSEIQTAHVSINLATHVPRSGDNLHLWWVLEETYLFNETDFPDPFGNTPPPCYIIQQYGPGQVNLFTQAGYNSDSVRINGLIEREIDESFLAKHIFSVYQHSVSIEHFEYLKSLEFLVENSGSLFDTPPGQAIGNFEAIQGTEVAPYGYFGAVLIDTSRIAVYPSSIRAPIPDVCSYVEGMPSVEYPSRCRDCTTLPRSSRDRPEYWTRF